MIEEFIVSEGGVPPRRLLPGCRNLCDLVGAELFHLPHPLQSSNASRDGFPDGLSTQQGPIEIKSGKFHDSTIVPVDVKEESEYFVSTKSKKASDPGQCAPRPSPRDRRRLQELE